MRVVSARVMLRGTTSCGRRDEVLVGGDEARMWPHVHTAPTASILDFVGPGYYLSVAPICSRFRDAYAGRFPLKQTFATAYLSSVEFT